MTSSNYWTRRVLSRRRALQGGAVGLVGLAAAAVVGCGDDDEDPGSTPAPGGSPTSGATATAAPVKGGTLKVRSYLEGPLHFDVFTSLDKRVQQYAMYVYSPLLAFKYGADVKPGMLEVGPHLAKSVETPDATTITLKLSDGVRFHNKAPVSGRPLVVNDVVYSLKRRMDTKSPSYGTLYAAVDSITAPDAGTIQMKLKTPFAPALSYLATMHATTVAPEVAEKGSMESSDTAIGTGPWMLDSFEPKVKIKYSRHPEYFKTGLPYFNTIEESVISETALVAALRSGQVDIALGNSWDLAKQAANDKLFILQNQPQTLIRTILTMRSDKPPFNDVKVRRAISMAIDRDGMSQGLFEGRSYLNPPLPLGFGDWSVPIDQLGDGSKYYKRNIQEAKKLLSEANLPNGFETKITSLNVLPQYLKDQLNVIVKNLEDIGIKATLDLQDYAAFAGQVLRGNMEAMGFTSSGGSPDPDSLLYGVYHTGEAQNYSHVSDTKLDAMLEAQRGEIITAKRKQLVADIQKYLADQQYIVYLPTSFGYDVVDKNIDGYGREVQGKDIKNALGDPFMEGIVFSQLWRRA